MADFLIFIDTNILLDFYRVRGRESGLLIFKHIDENLPRFITSSQVEMEFKKHRQRVILESLGLFKPPDWGGLQLPAFISESKQSKALTKNQNQVKKLSTTLKGRMTKVLENPQRRTRCTALRSGCSGLIRSITSAVITRGVTPSGD